MKPCVFVEKKNAPKLILMRAVFAWVKEKFSIAKAAEIMENPVEYNSFMAEFKKSPDYGRFMGI